MKNSIEFEEGAISRRKKKKSYENPYYSGTKEQYLKWYNGWAGNKIPKTRKVR
jgi:hypothetical protein